MNHTRLSASGQQSYEGWSCRLFIRYFDLFDISITLKCTSVANIRINLMVLRKHGETHLKCMHFQNFYDNSRICMDNNRTKTPGVLHSWGQFFFLWRCGPTRAMASSFLRFLDHTQRRATVGRTPLDAWSVRLRDLYLTTHYTHNRQTSMHPGGIRTHNLSRRAAVDLRLRPRGNWDRPEDN